jgi:hypothetical protein
VCNATGDKGDLPTQSLTGASAETADTTIFAVVTACGHSWEIIIRHLPGHPAQAALLLRVGRSPD